MTDIYQPAVILHLLEHGGTASKQKLARTLSGYDRSVHDRSFQVSQPGRTSGRSSGPSHAAQNYGLSFCGCPSLLLARQVIRIHPLTNTNTGGFFGMTRRHITASTMILGVVRKHQGADQPKNVHVT